MSRRSGEPALRSRVERCRGRARCGNSCRADSSTPLPRSAHSCRQKGTDFATDADLEAEEAVLDIITSNRPSDRVVAEESGATGNMDSDRCWLVDPLCGTENFAAGTGPVGINVALIARDRIAAAAVADPLTADAYRTDHTSAWQRSDGRDTRLEPSADSRLIDLDIDASRDLGAGASGLIAAADERTHADVLAAIARLRPRP